MKKRTTDYNGEYGLCWLRLGDVQVRRHISLAHNVSQRQLRLLLTIATCNEIAGGPVTFGALAEAECIVRATICQGVCELAVLGHVTRIGRHRAMLTPSGITIVQTYQVERRKKLHALLARLEKE